MTRGFDEDVERVSLFGLTQVAFSEVIAASLPAGLARFEAFLDRGHSVGLDDPGRHLCIAGPVPDRSAYKFLQTV